MNKIYILIFSLLLIHAYISDFKIFVNGLDDEEILFEKKASSVEVGTDSEESLTGISSESSANTVQPEIVTSHEEGATLEEGTDDEGNEEGTNDEENPTKDDSETEPEDELDYEGLYNRIQHISNAKEFLQCIKSYKVDDLICILDEDIIFTNNEMNDWKPLYFNGTLIGNKHKIKIESFELILNSKIKEISYGLFSKVISNSIIEDLHIIVEKSITLTSSYEINNFGVLSGIIEKNVKIERVSVEINSFVINDIKNTVGSNIGLLAGICSDSQSINHINIIIRNIFTINNSINLIYGNLIGKSKSCRISYITIIIPKYSVNSNNNNNEIIITIGGIIGKSIDTTLIASYIYINYYIINNKNNKGVYNIGFLIGDGLNTILTHSFVVIPQFYINSNNNDNNNIYIGGFLSKSNGINITSCYTTIVFMNNELSSDLKNIHYGGIFYTGEGNNDINDCYLSGKVGLFQSKYLISGDKDLSKININTIIIDYTNLNDKWKLYDFTAGNNRILSEDNINNLYVITDIDNISGCNDKCKIIKTKNSADINSFENINFIGGFWRFNPLGLSQVPLVDINSIITQSVDINIMKKVRFYIPTVYNIYFNNENWIIPLQGLPYLADMNRIYLSSTVYSSTYSVDVNYKYLNKNKCLNECNHHGTCMNNVCICDSGYMGLDCSFLNCISDNSKVVEEVNGLRKTKVLNECTGNGICNRESGLCECNAKFDGVGCSKTVN